MLKEVDINFLIKSIHYFRDFRRENLEIYTSFYKRLDRFFGNSKEGKKSFGISASLLIKLITPISMLLRQFLRLPYYIIQTISLRRSQCENIKSCHAFCIASSRFDLDESESVATQLESILESIGGRDVLNLFSGHAQNQKTIILYDPQLESGFWRRSRVSHNEKLFIFDGAYIIFLSLVLVVTGIVFRGAEEIIFIRRYLKQSKDSKDEKLPRLYVRVVEALTFITYHSLINRLPKHSSTLLTSNSFFVELLRSFILQNNGSGKIVEVLHGIIADPTEVWFQRLLSSQDNTKEKKHLLIPQVPDLPQLSTLDNKYYLENNICINTYLNSSLYENRKIHGSYKEYALNHLEQLNLSPHDKLITLTIYGGTSIG